MMDLYPEEDVIKIAKIDESFYRISSPPGILYEIAELFVFFADNYKFNPKYKARIWDGKIRLFSPTVGRLYSGLLLAVMDWADKVGYSVVLDPAISVNNSRIYPSDIGKYIGSNPSYFRGELLKVRDYQMIAVYRAIRDKRVILQSATSSGKSLMIHYIIQYLMDNEFEEENKILLVVPTISLVSQMYDDFREYSESKFNPSLFHQITGGVSKHNDKARVFISTYQSLLNVDKEYFQPFRMVIIDECHQAKSTSIKTILEKCSMAEYRIGTTGTPGSQLSSRMTLESVLGPIKKIVSANELMVNKQVSQLTINAITLKYPPEIRESCKTLKYPDEIDFLISNEKRNDFISEMTNSIKGNTLILLSRVEHGKTLYDRISSNRDNVYFIFGDSTLDEREQLRHIVEDSDNSVIIATYGVFSTGISIKAINNIIFASSSKSEIRVLQSIGRGLRISKNKNSVVLFDLVDDLSWKSHSNYMIKHFMERMNYYKREKFEVKVINHSLYKNNYSIEGMASQEKII